MVAFWYTISNSFDFFESLKILLINTVTIFMMSATLATPGLLKIKIFQNKGYDVIILDYHVSNKILSRDSIYIADLVAFLSEKLS